MSHTFYTFVLFQLIFNPWNGYIRAETLSEGLTAGNPTGTRLFVYDGLSQNEKSRYKLIINSPELTSQFVSGEKPKGLHKTLLDLDFPNNTTTTSTIHRVVQFLMNGEVTEMQRELYKDVELKISASGESRGITGPCSNELVVKLTRGPTFRDHGYFTQETDGFEKEFTLNKGEEKVIKFENVLGDDFPMDRFWVQFFVKGRCIPHLYVELMKPNNMADSLQ